MPPASTPLIDPKAMFHQAASFDYTATLVEFQNLLVNQSGCKHLPNEFINPTIVPIVIISSFSVEIYFKFLYRIECGSNPPFIPGTGGGHDLVKLFDNLPIRIQNDIIQEYDNFMITDPQIVKSDEIWKSSTGKIISHDFYKDLESARLAFYRWRYHYEYPTLIPGANPQAIRIITRLMIINKYSDFRAIWEMFPPMPLDL